MQLGFDCIVNLVMYFVITFTNTQFSYCCTVCDNIFQDISG